MLNCEVDSRLTKTLANKLKAFKELILDLLMNRDLRKPSDFVRYCIEKTGIWNMYDGTDEESRNKRMNLDEFVNSAIEFEKSNEGIPFRTEEEEGEIKLNG